MNQPPAAPDNIEAAHDKFKGVIREWIATKIAGQAALVADLIKPILVTVLEWRPEELTDCKTPAAPYECVRLTIEKSSRAAVLIQKTSLGLKDRNADRAYRLDGPVFATTEAAEAIKQACIVCGLKNTELAIVTNGEEWIVFRGSRAGDGKDTMEGVGFVFQNLDAIRDNFRLFYDLLSRGPIVELRYRAHFQDAEGQPIRTRAFSRVLRDPHQLKPLPRTDLAKDLDKVMESFFHRLGGDKDPDMLLRCFVTTRESTVAEDKIARIAEDLVGRIRTLETETADQLTTIVQNVAVTHHNEFVLLVGTKGAGKSTFIARFFKHVLGDEIRRNCIVVRIDLRQFEGSETTVTEWLNDNLLKATEDAIHEDRPPTDDELQGMFFDEYRRWMTGTHKHQYESDKQAFKIEFGRHIEEKRTQRPHDYICRLINHIVKNRKKAPCIVMDNADHFSIGIQERIFQYARSIYEREGCLVIMPITDKTSWQLTREGALSSFETTALFLPTPPPKRVLEQRIRYLEERVSDKDEVRGRGYFLTYNIRLSLDHLKAFTHCLQHVFLETGMASLWVGNLTNMDIRSSLDLTRDIMSSPYIKVDDLLKAYIAKSATAIQEYDIERAIIRRQFNFYPVGNNKVVQNIYSLRTEIGTSPLIGLRILQAMQDTQHTEEMGKESFVAVSQLYDYFQATKIERRVVQLWLDAMLRSRLCLSYDPTQTTIENVTSVELSPCGRQHLYWGTQNEAYIGSMMEVTPIQDQRQYERMFNVPQNDKRLEWYQKTGLFLDYLISEDQAYVTMPAHESYNGQRQLAEKLDRLNAKLRLEFERLRDYNRYGYGPGTNIRPPQSVRETGPDEPKEQA